jgi:nucleoid-associated protein YgaU
MIGKNSRYARLETYTIIDAHGITRTALKMRLNPPTPAVFQHTVKENDRLDLIAFQYYGKADRFWRICDANNEMLPDDLLEPGRQVLIPPDLPA